MPRPERVLITGGCGFIGSHAARRFHALGSRITLADDCSRAGATARGERLRTELRGIAIAKLDVRNAQGVAALVRDVRPDLVLHLAAQVAVTCSVTDPRHDFEVNALGTLNVLEAVRAGAPEAAVIYASTNKVYGELAGVAVEEGPTRHRFADRPYGIDESQPLDFYSPYGCSKGAGDQYVRDYARIYQMRAVPLRLSCIYGPDQLGVEDQGWLAWFAIARLLGRPITIYGDGKQARDVLFVEDLVELFVAVHDRIDAVAGRPINAGGGPSRVLSVWHEYGPLLDGLVGGGPHPPPSFAGWRPGDQRAFVTDVRLAQKLVGWSPTTTPAQGVERLVRWVRDNRADVARAFGP